MIGGDFCEGYAKWFIGCGFTRLDGDVVLFLQNKQRRNDVVNRSDRLPDFDARFWIAFPLGKDE